MISLAFGNVFSCVVCELAIPPSATVFAQVYVRNQIHDYENTIENSIVFFLCLV